MVLQLKTDYQQGIALRATAHKISLSLKKIIDSINDMVDKAGTNTAHRVTHVQLRKFTNQAKVFVNIANDPKSKDMDNLALQLKLEKAFLDTQNSNIKQRMLLHNEMTNHPGTAPTYQPVMDALTILAHLNIADITSLNFSNKSETLAKELFNVSTMNAYAELVRAHDLTNKAIIAHIEKPMASQFKMQVNTKPKEFKADLASSNEDAFAQKIGPGLKMIYENRFAKEVTEQAIKQAREIFDVESDPSEFKQLEGLLQKLADKNASNRHFMKPLTQSVTAIVYQSLVDSYAESN